MQQNNLRTYHRRTVTRESGFHTCNDSTGGECILKYTERLEINKKTVLHFHRDKVFCKSLFNNSIGLLCFGGMIFAKDSIHIDIKISCTYNKNQYTNSLSIKNVIEQCSWGNIGNHIEIPMNKDSYLYDCDVELVIDCDDDNILDFISFDFDALNKQEFIDNTCKTSFYQKTNMHIPYLYYLETEKSILQYLVSNQKFQKGFVAVLKSCNRCGRFQVINTQNELKTLSYSLHCKKRAPCTHTTFRAYKIMNINSFSINELKGININNGYVISYYGHQLECKACKKFFVNAPLNPQRNPQQFKEDGLRRRAIEVLINELLGKNLIHFEFEHKTKKEFSKYIWEKFDKKCFKCGKELKFEEMALDHTMPLAYLYRLDETATCLCSSHNSQKSDHFPVDYYSKDELTNLALAKITGLDTELISSRKINNNVLELLVKNVVWYFDDFLMRKDYQKIRDGIKTADKINDSLKRVISGKYDLAEEYKKITGKYPSSVTII